MILKDMVVGAVTGYKWPQISTWANSLIATGFQGTKLIICYNTDDQTISKLRKKGFVVLSLPALHPNKTIHSDRFHQLHSMLMNYGAGEYNRIMITDVKDVVFQIDPTEWLDDNFDPLGKIFCFATEGIKYRDESWGYDNVKEGYGQDAIDCLKENIIINAGAICGNWCPDFLTFIKDLHTVAMEATARLSDQSALNIIMDPRHREWYGKSKIYSPREGFCANLGTLFEPQYYPVLIDGDVRWENTTGKIYSQNGRLFCMVHQYDRVDGLKQEIWRQYWEA